MANKVRTETEEAVLEHGGAEFAMRISAGVSTYPDNQAIGSAEDLLRVAENALAQAKSPRRQPRVHRRGRSAPGTARRPRGRSRSSLLELAEDLLALDDFRVVKGRDRTHRASRP
jgi:GGDEF domain-containing protein